MSPDKESNSPQGSTNSHETEDYTQESANRGIQFYFKNLIHSFLLV